MENISEGFARFLIIIVCLTILFAIWCIADEDMHEKHSIGYKKIKSKKLEARSWRLIAEKDLQRKTGEENILGEDDVQDHN